MDGATPSARASAAGDTEGVTECATAPVPSVEVMLVEDCATTTRDATLANVARVRAKFKCGLIDHL